MSGKKKNTSLNIKLDTIYFLNFITMKKIQTTAILFIWVLGIVSSVRAQDIVQELVIFPDYKLSGYLLKLR